MLCEMWWHMNVRELREGEPTDVAVVRQLCSEDFLHIKCQFQAPESYCGNM